MNLLLKEEITKINQEKISKIGELRINEIDEIVKIENEYNSKEDIKITFFDRKNKNCFDLVLDSSNAELLQIILKRKYSKKTSSYIDKIKMDSMDIHRSLEWSKRIIEKRDYN